MGENQKEKLAQEYALKQEMNKTSHLIGFIAGYSAAIEKIKEYLFNTENHPENISEEYLKQTIKFLLDNE